MIHVLLASALPLAVFFAWWWRRGRRVTPRGLVTLAIACLVSGAWAVAPDLPRLWGDRVTYVELHHRSYCDAWWFHCTIDRHEDIDSSMLFPVLFVLAAVAVLAVAWRELVHLERGG
jgi:drug/metabolite transporter (DMT)-like permease